MSLATSLVGAAATTALTVFSAHAETLPAPTGPVLLTISGALNNETADGVVTLDLDILKSLDTQVFRTSTIWLEGEIEFTGVNLRDVLDYAGATGETFSAIALNDYSVEIPNDSIEAGAPIVAYLMDGAKMSPRGKGPLWIVYPYDQNASYRTEVTSTRSIWQLDQIKAHQ
ncbi:MAG: hypothetical protein ACI9KK_001881 [Ascidiaceihabitans sp.]|jgi:hypothetical protein